VLYISPFAGVFETPVLAEALMDCGNTRVHRSEITTLQSVGTIGHLIINKRQLESCMSSDRTAGVPYLFVPTISSPSMPPGFLRVSRPLKSQSLPPKPSTSRRYSKTLTIPPLSARRRHWLLITHQVQYATPKIPNAICIQKMM
jgi:hypothetical protein